MIEDKKAERRKIAKVYLTEANIKQLRGVDKETKYFDAKRAGLFVKVGKQKLYTRAYYVDGFGKYSPYNRYQDPPFAKNFTQCPP